MTVALVLCLSIVLCVGCSAPIDQTAEDPGIYDLGDGRIRVVGSLQRVELEGGFWAIAELGLSDDDSDASDPTVIAIIRNADEFVDEISEMKTSSVAVTGVLYDGVSIRMAGPEMTAESIEKLEE